MKIAKLVTVILIIVILSTPTIACSTEYITLKGYPATSTKVDMELVVDLLVTENVTAFLSLVIRKRVHVLKPGVTVYIMESSGRFVKVRSKENTFIRWTYIEAIREKIAIRR